MADESSDALMTFIPKGSDKVGVPAEGQATWNKDELMTDFTAGHFFEVKDFSLGGGIEDDSSSEKESQSSSTKENRGYREEQESQKTNASSGSSKKVRHGSRFNNFFATGATKTPDGKAPLYGAHLQEISVTRVLDKASPKLLEYCLKLESFTKAVIVKRKVVGRAHGGTREHQGFLRLEFEEPLITSVEWDDGEVIEEKLKFVCRGIKVTYRPQNDDGSLGTQVPGKWNYKDALGQS